MAFSLLGSSAPATRTSGVNVTLDQVRYSEPRGEYTHEAQITLSALKSTVMVGALTINKDYGTA